MVNTKSSPFFLARNKKKQDTFPVQVSYADSKTSILLTVQVKPETTIREAIELSGIQKISNKIKPVEGLVGIFSEIKPLDTFVKKDDRIEIYRPLAVSPKEARQNRLKKIQNI